MTTLSKLNLRRQKMIFKKVFRGRTLISIIAVIILMIAAYAYAAANSVPETGAGDGSEAISGYTITNVHYTLGADPSQISAVTFNISPTAGAGPVREVQVQLVSGGTWFACDESAVPAISCSITGVTVLSANQFRVVAVQ
jgi:hypothetical protein